MYIYTSMHERLSEPSCTKAAGTEQPACRALSVGPMPLQALMSPLQGPILGAYAS